MRVQPTNDGARSPALVARFDGCFRRQQRWRGAGVAVPVFSLRRCAGVLHAQSRVVCSCAGPAGGLQPAGRSHMCSLLHVSNPTADAALHAPPSAALSCAAAARAWGQGSSWTCARWWTCAPPQASASYRWVPLLLLLLLHIVAQPHPNTHVRTQTHTHAGAAGERHERAGHLARLLPLLLPLRLCAAPAVSAPAGAGRCGAGGAGRCSRWHCRGFSKLTPVVVYIMVSSGHGLEHNGGRAATAPTSPHHPTTPHLQMSCRRTLLRTLRRRGRRWMASRSTTRPPWRWEWLCGLVGVVIHAV